MARSKATTVEEYLAERPISVRRMADGGRDLSRKNRGCVAKHKGQGCARGRDPAPSGPAPAGQLETYSTWMMMTWLAVVPSATETPSERP